MEVTYYGHSCFEVKIKESRLLFDPFITGNPLVKNMDIALLKPDFLLLSHAHGDHTGDALEILQQSNAILISNFEVVKWFEAKGVQGGIDLNHGGKYKTTLGRIRLVHAVHSSQFPDGKYGGTAGGFLVETEEGNFYYSGDTAVTMDMQLLSMFCQLKFAMLPVGGHYTMDYEDAFIASSLIKCDKILGMHFDTFPTITIDHNEAMSLFESNGKKLLLMKIGETITL